MKWSWLPLLPALAAGSAATANPIRKVVTLLQNMAEEIKKEGEQEEDMHKKMTCYCKHNSERMGDSERQAAAEIEKLKSMVKEETAQKAQSEQELKEAKADREAARQTMKKAIAIREKEANQYAADTAEEHGDIKALKEAISALDRGMGNESFLQAPFVSRLKRVIENSDSSTSDSVDSSDREAVMAFLSQGSSDDYVPQSNQIVGILKNMLDEMDKSLGYIISAEDAAVKSFAELKEAKEKEIAALSEQIEAKTAAVGKLAVDIVTHQNQQDDSSDAQEQALKLAGQLLVMCKEKAGEYDERIATRAEELKAIGETIQFLNQDDSLDLFNKTLKKGGKAAFLQKNSNKNALQKARVLLQDAVKGDLPSTSALVLLAQNAASRVKALEHHKSNEMKGFEKVVKLCDNMISLLKEEQKQDDESRDNCLAKTKQYESESKDRQHTLQSLETSVASMDSEIEEYEGELKTLQDEVKALDKAVADASEQRRQEHEEFQANVQLTTAAMSLIEKAKNRLNKFYNPGQYQAPKQRELTREEELSMAAGGEDPRKAEQVTSFIEIKQHSNTTKDDGGDSKKPTLEGEAPESWNGEYKNKGQKTNAVTAMMNMLVKDLTADKQEAEHAEKTAQKDYEQLMTDSSDQKAANEKEIVEVQGAKATLEEERSATKDNVTVTKDQLLTVNTQLAETNQKCHFIINNYDEREALRTREIEGIQNAKAVLNGADYQ